MKHRRLSLLWVLLLSLLFVACSDSKDDDEDLQPENISHAELIGMYEVQNSKTTNVQDGDIWSIEAENISIKCVEPIAYVFKDNTLTVDGIAYKVAKSTVKDQFDLSFSGGSFTIAKTDRKCENKEIIAKEELIGSWKVADAYSHESGNTPEANSALIGKIWEIQGDEIRINCAKDMIAYTYDDNKIVAGEVEYSVEKKEGKLIISYLTGNIITTVHLETTTESCPEEKEPQTGNVELDKLYGYAQAAGTTGGEGGTVHHFDNGAKFTEWLKLREKAKSKEPAIVWLSGTFNKEDGRAAGSPWFDIKDTDNLSIYGTNSFRMKNVGFFLVRANNIIIRNVYIEMPKADNGADGISMQKSSKVWVDHCTFESINQTSDYEDGSCDITHGTKEVTVSWNHFIKTQKTALVGHSNSETGDVDITATFHHNFFDNSSSRHPRVRFGKVHVYNNFFNAVTTYGVGSAYGAKVLVEANYFDGVRLPTDICTYPAKKSGSSWVSNLQGSEAGYLFEAQNIYENKPENANDPYPLTNVEYTKYEGEKLAAPLTRADFTPAYEYIIDNPEDLKNIVSTSAGVGKLPNYETAPIAVNNGGISDTENPEEPEKPENPGGIELGNGWTAINMGGDAKGAHSISEGGGITMTGLGKFESGKQTFYYIYREITGDFVMTARLDSYTPIGTSNQAEAGLMMTSDYAASATDLIHALCGKGGNSAFNYSQRIATSTNAGKGTIAAPATTGGETYLKLERAGNTYQASYSLDGGVTYGTERKATFTVTLPDKMYIGLVVSSGDNSKTANATFSDIKVNGTSVGF